MQCVFCMATQVIAAEGLTVNRPDVFVFPDGLFAGKTISEVADLEDGPTYLEFMSRKAKSAEVAEKCKAWVDSQAAAS